MKTSRRAIVIGGGIAGPALALFLARAGIEPLVFEAYPRTDDVGGGFQIAPNGLRVLAALGLEDAMMGAGVPSRGMCFRNHHGRTIGVVRTERSGVAVNLTRAAFQRILRDECERRGIAIAYGKRLRAITQAGAEVVAELEDGSVEIGDFLVGADGVASRVRAWMAPDHARARYTGMIGLGAFCAGSVAPPPDASDADRLTFIVGPRHQLGYSRMGQGWAWWCHALAETDAERADLLTMPDDRLRDRMLDRYRGWCAPAPGFIAGTESWIRTPIHDIPSLPSWHRGRVVLIGDAAHAMSPAAGQGASLALEDAMLFGSLLADRSLSIEGAMARFEAIQKKYVESVVAQGYENDRRSLKELGALGMWMRDRMLMPLIAPMITRSLTRVYERRVGDLARSAG